MGQGRLFCPLLAATATACLLAHPQEIWDSMLSASPPHWQVHGAGRGRGCWRGNQKRGKWPAACFGVQEHSGDQPSVLRHRGLMKTKGEAAGWQQNH